MARKNRKRTSNRIQQPSIAKIARSERLKPDASDDGYLGKFVRFRFDRIDIDGPWGWTSIPAEQIKGIFSKLGQFEGHKWGGISSMG